MKIHHLLRLKNDNSVKIYKTPKDKVWEQIKKSNESRRKNRKKRKRKSN